MSLTTDLVPPAARELLDSADANAVFKHLIEATNQWHTVVESEQTRRTAIAADEHKWLAAIEADRTALLTYLDRSFDERASNFRELFSALDKSLATDPSKVADILGAITTLAMKSPFNDIADTATVTANLRDQGYEW